MRKVWDRGGGSETLEKGEKLIFDRSLLLCSLQKEVVDDAAAKIENLELKVS